MAETTWVNGVSGAVSSSEQVFAANTVLNLYGCKIGDDLSLLKKGPDTKFYPHSVDGGAKIGKINSSFILATPGTYKVVGVVKSSLYITYEAL